MEDWSLDKVFPGRHEVATCDKGRGRGSNSHRLQTWRSNLQIFRGSSQTNNPKQCNYRGKDNHTEKDVFLRERHEAQRNRARGRGSRNKSNFPQSNESVKQNEPKADYLPMACKEVPNFQCMVF